MASMLTASYSHRVGSCSRELSCAAHKDEADDAAASPQWPECDCRGVSAEGPEPGLARRQREWSEAGIVAA